MESNRDEASRCIDLTKFYIKKKDLDNAWKFSVKANKLFPSPETKRLVAKLKSSMKKKHRSKKRNKSESNGSDESYNGDYSNSSSSNDSNSQNPTKKSKQVFKSSTAYSFKMFKEINKDESYKCLEKAEEHMKKNQYEFAEKFILKSKKLFPLPQADELLKKLQKMQETNQKNYTEKEANIVNKVKNSENFYKMLDIETTATVPEIKKAFKKLALLLHPDKNHAPGAGETFIVLNNAVETLCDPIKCKAYDATLKKRTTPTNFKYHSSKTGSRRFYETFMYTEDLPNFSYPKSFQQKPLSSDSDDCYCTENESYSGYSYYETFEY